MDLMGREPHLYARLHRLAVLFAAVVFATVVAIAIGTGSAKAAPAVAVLGAAAPAEPACPANCQAVAKTTGFQISIGDVKSPFVVPYTGKIVAWSIKLGVPASSPAAGEAESQLSFFNSEFGPSQARLSVLKPVMKKVKLGKPIYKLKAQAPVEPLEQFFGTTTTFTLQQPIKVKQNQILALTIPTWAPALAVGQGGQSIWQASRKRARCALSPKTALEDTQAGRPQEVLGADRAYGCVYKTARILYSATLVKSPKAPAPSPGKKKPKS
ncbi:MAG: hypothetical protein M3O25_04330 [Actinomycetota bacterium]|nr:hypothetical protein [Actinomycetota bacterium]